MARRRFTPEFKRSAVALVVEQNYTRQQAAQNLGIGVATLDYWLQKHRKLNGAASNGGVDLVKRLAELERENKRLTMERDILKKAAAYFAKESLLSMYPNLYEVSEPELLRAYGVSEPELVSPFFCCFVVLCIPPMGGILREVRFRPA